MKATIYEERAKISVVDIPKPILVKSTDAIVRMTLAGICGADMDFTQNGPELGVEKGMRLGHEFVGVVEAVGDDVKGLNVGDRVVASAMFVDGECHYCKKNVTSACEQGGLFGTPMFVEHGGSDIQGGQSEFVRVPFASTTLFKLPESLSSGADDAKVLPLADNFATGFHGALNSSIQAGETVVIIGDGAVGLSAVMAANLFAPAQIIHVGRHDGRLEHGRKNGATHVVNSKKTDPVEYVKSLTKGYGALSVIDTAGSPESIKQSMDMAQAGAHISILGFGHLFAPAEAPYNEALFRNLTIHTGVVNVAAYMNILLPMVESGRLDPSVIFTDILPLEDAVKGYDLMRTRAEGTIKVALKN